ncbi:MAG TPA: FixH family protein [Polyangia bacterium]|jgi:hypothetical protein|nr:FixH family protein [Polyangia bacterium]
MRSAPGPLGGTAIAIVLGLTGAGCKSSGAADDGGVMGDVDFVNCAAETRATPFRQGMQVTSRNGTYLLKVLKNTFQDPTLQVLTIDPAKGVDVWTIEIDAAATGAPLDGMSIAVKPFMPDHNHGTTAVGITAAGAGTYTIAPLNLYMAGYWEITFNLTDISGDAPTTDSAMVPICIPD